MLTIADLGGMAGDNLGRDSPFLCEVRQIDGGGVQLLPVFRLDVQRLFLGRLGGFAVPVGERLLFLAG